MKGSRDLPEAVVSGQFVVCCSEWFFNAAICKSPEIGRRGDCDPAQVALPYGERSEGA